MIVKAHQINAHEDFTLTQYLNSSKQFVNTERLVRTTKEFLSEIFNAPKISSNSHKTMTIEEYLFASSITFKGENDMNIIYHDFEDNVMDRVTNLSVITTYAPPIIRLFCFGKDEFANQEHYFIVRSTREETDADNYGKNFLTIFVDSRFGETKDNDMTIKFIGELVENFIYLDYDDKVVINESTMNLDSYLDVSGKYCTNYSSLGKIVVPEIITPHIASFIITHYISVIWAMLTICSVDEVKKYIKSFKSCLYHNDMIDDMINKTNNACKSTDNDMIIVEMDHLVTEFAKRYLREEFYDTRLEERS